MPAALGPPPTPSGTPRPAPATPRSRYSWRLPGPASSRRLPLQVFAEQDRLGDLDHRDPAALAGLAHAAVGLILGEPLVAHQDALPARDVDPVAEPLLRPGELVHRLTVLPPGGQRDLDARPQLFERARVGQVRPGPRLDRQPHGLIRER